jgi:hypothetical protein
MINFKEFVAPVVMIEGGRLAVVGLGNSNSLYVDLSGHPFSTIHSHNRVAFNMETLLPEWSCTLKTPVLV